MAYWLVKTDPETYSIDDFREEGTTVWDGVRNYQARNNMNMMKKGDSVLIYHSNKDRSVVGLAKVVKTAHQDPTTDDERWTAVDLKLVRTFIKTPDLALIKKTEGLENIALIKQSRLSVMPLTKEEFDIIIHLTK